MEFWEFIGVFILGTLCLAVILFLFSGSDSSQVELKSTGRLCNNSTECLSRNCSNSICAPSTLYSACKIDSDCIEGICNYDFCSKSTVGGRCNKDEDCEDSKCLKNECKELSEYYMCFFVSWLQPYSGLLWVLLLIGVVLLILGLGGRSTLSHGEWGFNAPTGIILIIISLILLWLVSIC